MRKGFPEGTSRPGKASITGLLLAAVVGILLAVMVFALTSVLNVKLTTKTILSALVGVGSFIWFISNLEDFLSFIERITGIDLKPEPKPEPGAARSEKPKEERLRVLTVMPRPLDAENLPDLADPEKIVETFQRIDAPVDIDFVRPPTFENFRTKLKNGYDVIHFDGHGSPETLLFEKDDGLQVEIPVEKFAGAVKSAEKRPKLIVLSACETAKGRRPFARQLHNVIGTAVIGFSREVYPDETEKFSERFYEELGSGKTLGEAFDSAVDALSEEHPNTAEAAKLFGRRSLRLVKPGSEGEVRVETMDWFRVPNPLQTPIFVGVMTWKENEPGRMDMLHEILSNLRDVSVRKKLILLHGDGGFGKTALAYEAARRLAPNFRGGVLWFDGRGRAEISLDSFLDGTFGTVLGEEFTKGDPEIKRKMAVEFLRARSEAHEPVLIVADNLDFASKLVWNFLTYLPERCSAIATSRIVPKDVPTIEKFRVNELLEEEAIQLLHLYADIRIDGELAKEILRLTGGVPAAIEFAAGDIRDFGVRSTIKNLKKWPSKDLTTRFDFTYEPLDDEMKRFLWLISMFPAVIEPEIHLKLMCEKFSDDDQPPFGERWEKLWDELVRRRQWVRLSFLEGRYEMHPVVRDYIQHKAKDADPETLDSFERRFVRVMSEIANYLSSQLQAEAAAQFVQFAAVEHDSLLEAQRIAREKGMWQEVLAFAYVLDGLFERSGHWSDRWEVLKNGLEAARKLDKRRDEGAMLNSLGNLAMDQGRYDEAKEYFKKALSISEELGNRAGVAGALNNLGNLALRHGLYDEAKGYFERALKVFDELGQKAGMAVALGNLGNLAMNQGRYDEAKEYFEKALSISEELSNRAGVAQTLLGLGNLALDLGRYDEAKEYFERALKVFDELGQRAEVATAFNDLGNLAFNQGRYDEAKGYYEKSLEIEQELGDRAGVAQTLLGLGNLASVQGRYDEAKGYYEKSLEIEQELGNRAGMAQTLHNLGNLAFVQGRYDEAKGYYEKSLEIEQELGDRAGVALSLSNLGNLAMNQGRYDEAKEYYKKSLSISEELGNRAGVAQTLHNLGNLANDLNKPELAFRFTTIALFMFASMGHADAQKAGKNLVLYARKLGYDEEKIETELNKIVQEFGQRGYEPVDELLRELEDAVG